MSVRPSNVKSEARQSNQSENQQNDVNIDEIDMIVDEFQKE